MSKDSLWSAETNARERFLRVLSDRHFFCKADRAIIVRSLDGLIDSLWEARQRSCPSPPEPDPAKRDTCGNCGALDWAYPVNICQEAETIQLARACRCCGRVEVSISPGEPWVMTYPGKGAKVAE